MRLLKNNNDFLLKRERFCLKNERKFVILQLKRKKGFDSPLHKKDDLFL